MGRFCLLFSRPVAPRVIKLWADSCIVTVSNLGSGKMLVLGRLSSDMYMKTKGVEDGRRVSHEMRETNVVSRTSLISGYARNGLNDRALELFLEMQLKRNRPNPFTYVAVLGVLADGGLVGEGNQVHTMLINNGYASITFMCNSLINMYLKSGIVEDAREVFDSMPSRDEVTWNSLIAGYVTNGLELEALDMFNQMAIAGIKFTQPIFVTVIKLCANNEELGFARQLHCCVLKSGLASHWNIETSLLVAYSKFKEMDNAYKMFSIQILKSLRVCGDCHIVIKLISVIEARDIVVRDSNRFHHFKGGLCSCGDYW